MPFNPHRLALPAGRNLHWYTIDGVLGQGGLGITYLAHDPNLDQPVAIKEYLPSELAVRSRDDSVHPVSEKHRDNFRWGLERFLTEARILSRFEHPNIVRVLAIFEMNQTAYMVMRYESGSSLEQMLPANATLEESWVKRMVFPIIDGLSLVHESGFIHRDIKPGNLFIREDSSPVLIDFGSARQAMGHATRTLTTIVSPGYAPFEQYHAKSDRQGPWTDVYGLGATLYRAVTGVMPTDALDRSESLLSAGEDSYVPVANLARERYDPAFLDAIDHALAFREADRPRSLSDWACELQGERPGNPAIPSRAPAAKPVSMGVPNGVTDRRRDRHASRYLRRIAVLGSAAVLAVVIGLSLKPTNFDPNASDPVAGLISHEDEVYELADEFGAEETPAWEDEPIDEADEPGETTLEDYEPVEVVWGPPDLGENLMAAWDGLAEMRLSGNNGDNVVALYREVLREDPGNREALIGLQTVFDYHVTRSRDAVRAGDFETAREIMQEALQAAPDREARAFARRRLARLLQHLG